MAHFPGASTWSGDLFTAAWHARPPFFRISLSILIYGTAFEFNISRLSAGVTLNNTHTETHTSIRHFSLVIVWRESALFCSRRCQWRYLSWQGADMCAGEIEIYRCGAVCANIGGEIGAHCRWLELLLIYHMCKRKYVDHDNTESVWSIYFEFSILRSFLIMNCGYLMTQSDQNWSTF